jgi:ribosomal protein L11 methyltransferase
MSIRQSFIEISALVHPDAVEGVTEILLSLGAKGAAEEGTEAQRRVTAYFPEDDRTQERVAAVERRLEDLRAAGVEVGVGFVAVRVVEEVEWGDLWRVHFHASRIAPNLIIVPSWEEYQPKAGEHVIVLDPGAAFGTGGHATTRLCLRALSEQVRSGDRVADIGCGSGVLAVAAALLGASRVIATDSDPTAIPVAQFNVERNQVADRVEILESDLLPLDLGPFEIAVCNILAPEVIRLAADLPALLVPGGRFIGSGFVLESVPLVKEALHAAGMEVVSAPEEEEWAAVVARRREEG